MVITRLPFIKKERSSFKENFPLSKNDVSLFFGK